MVIYPMKGRWATLLVAMTLMLFERITGSYELSGGFYQNERDVEYNMPLLFQLGSGASGSVPLSAQYDTNLRTPLTSYSDAWTPSSTLYPSIDVSTEAVKLKSDVSDSDNHYETPFQYLVHENFKNVNLEQTCLGRNRPGINKYWTIYSFTL